MRATPDNLDAGKGAAGQRRLWVGLALLLGAAVFAIDTFTDVHGAIAVLYVVVLLLASDSLSRHGLLLAGAATVFLTLLSLAIAHGSATDFGAALRCATALAAIAITTALLLRNQKARNLLIRANRALSLSEQRYRSIFQQTSVSLWEQDYSRLWAELSRLKAGGVEDFGRHAAGHPHLAARLADLIQTADVNAATVALLKVPSRDAVLGPLSPFLETDAPELLRVVQAIFEGKRQIEGKGSLVRADGTRLTVLYSINLPEDPQAFDRVVVAVLDITQREEMQEALMIAQAELARASRLATLGAVSASIAHELNQPLGALVMNAQTCLRWLRRDPPDLESAIKAVERSVRDGRRASEILQRTRGMLVKHERREAELDLREVILEAEMLLERELAQKGGRISKDFAADLPPVLADRVELQQVLINLISNGLNAMEEARVARPEISIEVLADAEEVSVSLRDRGKGIDQTVPPKLFEPFFTTRVGGMGMGLAICRSLIEARGGRLTAANHPDGGAVFRFTLPCAAAAKSHD